MSISCTLAKQFSQITPIYHEEFSLSLSLSLVALLFLQFNANTSHAQTAVSASTLTMSTGGEIYFRGGDYNHGLGWYGVPGRDTKLWNGEYIDGAVLYGYSGGALGFNHYGTQTTVLRWNDYGKVIIGSVPSTPGNYSLYVENGILTEHVRVSSKTGTEWADAVFDRSYKLMTLHELQKYIECNHHLPDIPSAQEVKANGIDLAEIDKKLLQKVEELTLYVIKQQKEIDMLKRRLN
ncbi:MAG: hypothetical protein ABI169_07390 [Chitinophagaceae bacterium]